MMREVRTLSLVLFCLGLYVFIFFDDWMTYDFVNRTVGSKNRGWRLVVYTITQNNIGYWSVRTFTLLFSLWFGYDFIDGIRNKKTK
ncbi:hypothetical protein ACE939_11090 [Aquimarina sp. W85]|uniref:hypothetical protein n=1 Tax=Aquimarina rhodophyticola TaxID=3342246 RepID=UPI003671B53C